jgi:hypothetical protein
MAEGMFQEIAISEMNLQDRSGFFIKRDNGVVTINHRVHGQLCSRRFKKIARVFKKLDAAANVLEKYGIKEVTVKLQKLPKESEK